MRDGSILDLRLDDNDANARTVRDYLQALLMALFNEGADFKGEHPFGNTGWVRELQKPMIEKGIIRGIIDEDGYVEDCDQDAFQAAIKAAIIEL